MVLILLEIYFLVLLVTDMKIEIYSVEPKILVLEKTYKTDNFSLNHIKSILETIKKDLNIPSFREYIIRIDCG